MTRDVAIDSGELSRSIPQFDDECDDEVFLDKMIEERQSKGRVKNEDKPEVVVVIPAYNEELTIGTVVLKAKKHATDVLVIDDGSKDHTAEVARLAGAKVIQLAKNGGKAHAIITGLSFVKGNGYSAAILMDGDGQHRSEDIESLLKPVLEGEADLVIGSRFLKRDNTIPIYRQAGQRLLNGLTNAGSNQKVTDTQSGFRAMSKKGLQNMDFESDGYAIEQEMIVHFSDRGLKIKEVPVSVRYDVPNGHKQGSVSMGMGLLNNVIATVGYKRPLLLFGVPGLAFIIAGLLFGLASIFEMTIFGSWLFQVLLGITLVILGSFLCVSALTLNSLCLLMRSRNRL